MIQKIYIPQPIAPAGEDYLIEKGYEIVRGSGKTDKESIKNDIAVCDAMIQRTAKVDKEILEAGKSFEEHIIYYMGMPSKITVKTVWKDANGELYEKEQIVSF